MQWKPNVTVAAVIEQEQRFLLVRESIQGQEVFNQPAGHLEAGESLVQAVVRETLEETAWHFVPRALVGIYRWHNPQSDLTFLRFAFHGDAVHHDPARELDTEIVALEWLTLEEIRRLGARLRSPMVLRVFEDYRAGCRYPLQVLQDLHSN